MNITLQFVLFEDREILSNLLEKYHYEFTQYEPRDVNKLGLYGYQSLDFYWIDEKRWAYFIVVDGNLAGFVLVRNYPLKDTKTYFVIPEFFVMYKYRRSGVGRQAFFQVLNKHKGRWRICLHPNNITSVHFWDSVIKEYTKGQYKFLKSHPKVIYKDGILGNIYLFNSLFKLTKREHK
jgi:predicted acetyltransferase